MGTTDFCFFFVGTADFVPIFFNSNCKLFLALRLEPLAKILPLYSRVFLAISRLPAGCGNESKKDIHLKNIKLESIHFINLKYFFKNIWGPLKDTCYSS